MCIRDSLNGAFLTGDIFNLFVFFEVMLIASYGLLLSAGRGLRMRVGFHYVVFNVTASTPVSYTHLRGLQPALRAGDFLRRRPA